MAQCTNYPWIFISVFLLVYSVQSLAETPLGSSQEVVFTATINDGECTLDFDSRQSEVIFIPRLASDFSPGKTVEIRPITAQVGCDYDVTPQVTVVGNTPYASNTRVFLDSNPDWPDGTNGVGFMVLPVTAEDDRAPPSLGDFYTTGLGGRAAVNGVPMDVIPLFGANDYATNQVLWVGLVGMADSSGIIPGAFQAKLTITSYIP